MGEGTHARLAPVREILGPLIDHVQWTDGGNKNQGKGGSGKRKRFGESGSLDSKK